MKIFALLFLGFLGFVCEVQSNLLSDSDASFLYLKFKEYESSSLQSSYSTEEFEGKYYYFSKFPKNWGDAESDCVKIGGHLVSIHSHKEHNFVKAEAVKRNINEFWLGLNDIAIESHHVWSDGTPVDFTAWIQNEPNSAGERCIHYWKYFNGWNDYGCQNVYFYVCKA